MYMTSREIILSYYVQKIFLSLLSVLLIRKKLRGGGGGGNDTHTQKIHLIVTNPWNFVPSEKQKKSCELKAEAFARLVSLWRHYSSCDVLAHVFSWRALQPSSVIDIGCGELFAGF